MLLKIGIKNFVPHRTHILKHPRYCKSVHYYENAHKMCRAVLKKRPFIVRWYQIADSQAKRHVAGYGSEYSRGYGYPGYGQNYPAAGYGYPGQYGKYPYNYYEEEKKRREAYAEWYKYYYGRAAVPPTGDSVRSADKEK